MGPISVIRLLSGIYYDRRKARQTENRVDSKTYCKQRQP